MTRPVHPTSVMARLVRANHERCTQPEDSPRLGGPNKSGHDGELESRGLSNYRSDGEYSRPGLGAFHRAFWPRSSFSAESLPRLRSNTSL